MIYIDVESLSSNEAAIVKIAISDIDTGLMLNATGTSKRDPQDKSDTEVGIQLALGRALQSLGSKIEKRANGLVKHHDDIRVIKAKQELSKASKTKTTTKRAGRKV